MIEIKEGVVYNPELSFDEQSDEFKEHATAIYDAIQKVPYPDFNTDDSISYYGTDGVLEYEFKRVQVYPSSTTNRTVLHLLTIINIK